MKQSLSLKLGQSLTMTPQLQQAIRLLQLSSLDLQQEIQENLDSNPMLELDEDDESAEGAAAEDEAAEADNAAAEPTTDEPDFTTSTSASDAPAAQASVDEDGDALESVDLQAEEPIPEELPVDTSWDDIYQPMATPSGEGFMLLDEPFAGVDPISVNDIKKEIRDLTNRDIGVLITDHNVRDTLDICDRAYIVNEGHIIAEGEPGAILANQQVRNVYLGESFSL